MFSDEICYHGSVIITGGLGGVGLAMAKWMVERRNVRHLVLFARQNAHDVDEKSIRGQKIKELFRIGDKYSASIKVVKADVSDYEQVQRVINEINNSPFPVRGIIHGALVLRDSIVSNMTEKMLTDVLRPRILGAWNLHQASRHLKLEFFVLLGSLRNHMIDIGGANYNASNQFFDSLAHWRKHTLSLPALSITVPAIRGTSYVEKAEDDQTRIYRAFKGIPFEFLFELIEFFYREQDGSLNSLATPIIFCVEWDLLKTQLDYTKIARIHDLVNKNSAMHQEYHKNQEQTATAALSNVKIDDNVHRAVTKIFGSGNLDRIDRKTPLFEQGLDSLMAISLHNWLGATYSVFIPVVDITQGMSIDDIVTNINIKLANPPEQDTSASSTSTTTETSHATMNQIENVVDQRYTNKVEVSSEYRGTSLIAFFPTLSANTNQPILFCVLDNTRSEHDNLDFLALLASKTTRFSQVCLFLQPVEDNYNTIELAKEYIIQMRRIQPRGKYYLMGYKKGVPLACRMRNDLKKYVDAQAQVFILPHSSPTSITNGTDEKHEKDNSVIDLVTLNSYEIDNINENYLNESSSLFHSKVKFFNCTWNNNNMEQNEKELETIVRQIEDSFQ